MSTSNNIEALELEQKTHEKGQSPIEKIVKNLSLKQFKQFRMNKLYRHQNNVSSNGILKPELALNNRSNSNFNAMFDDNLNNNSNSIIKNNNTNNSNDNNNDSINNSTISTNTNNTSMNIENFDSYLENCMRKQEFYINRLNKFAFNVFDSTAVELITLMQTSFLRFTLTQEYKQFIEKLVSSSNLKNRKHIRGKRIKKNKRKLPVIENAASSSILIAQQIKGNR